MSTKLLITGIPGCGKSTFGRWLRDNKKFVFVDMEADADSDESLDAAGLRPSWDSFVDLTDRSRFIEELNSRAPVVLDWGFPLGSSGTVSALIRAGLEGWWFDGDRLTAREHFVRRATVPVLNFDIQCANIAGNWNLIETVFRTRIVKVAQTDGSLLAPEEIFHLIRRPN